MLRSRLAFLAKNFSLSRHSFTFNKRFPNTKKIALTSLAALTMVLTPKYISMKEQSAQHIKKQSTLIDNSTTQQTEQQKQQTKIQGKQQIQDNIINYIHDYNDAKSMNLPGHVLIWYQMSGNQVIDAEVVSMLEKFVKQRYHSISCPFKVVIDTTQRSRPLSQKSDYYKKQVQLVIIKPQDLKPIPLSRHLSYQLTKDLKYTNLFNRLASQLSQYTEINQKNIKQFINDFGDRSYESLIVINAPKDQVKQKKAHHSFGSFVQNKSMFTAHSIKGIVTDENAAKELGLPAYVHGSQNIYILVPDSDNIINPGHVVEIKNKKYHIFNPHNLASSVVFPPYLQKSPSQSLLLKVTADLNQNIGAQLASIYEVLAQGKSSQHPNLASLPKLLMFNSITDKNSSPVQISIQKNNFDHIVSIYSPECRYSNKDKKQALYSSNKWSYDQDQITADGLQKWVTDVLEHKVEPTYDSEKPEETKVKAYNSTRLTGEEYVKALHTDKQKPKIVFHYSEHCFSCKNFKHLFQQIAGEKSDKYDFYRIDNDFNRSKGLRNYNSTPVFIFYKQDGTPFYFKNTIFTKKLFEDFIEVTNNIKTFDKSIIDKAVQDRKNSEFNLSEFVPQKAEASASCHSAASNKDNKESEKKQ